MNSDFDWLKCVVCGIKKEYGRNIHFFKFPREINRCRSWLKAIGIRELISIPIEDLCELLVCASHFNQAFINEKGNRLHKVGIPCLTPYPSLSDNEMAGYPKHRAISNTVPLTHVFSLSEPANKTSVDCQVVGSQKNTTPIIDYGRPLMNSLETLINDNYLTVQKPTGIPSSIAVPLMSYSSSTEQGTVFGVEDPGSVFELPFAPFTESQVHHVYNAKKSMSNKVAKTNTDQLHHLSNVEKTLTTTMDVGGESPKMSNMKTEDMSYPVHPTAFDVSLTQNKDKTKPKILTKKTIIKTFPSYTSPLSKLIVLKPKPEKTATSNTLRIISNVAINNPTSGTLNQPLQIKPLRQYANTKQINSIQKKGRSKLNLPIAETTDQKHNTDLNANAASVVAVANETNQCGMNTFNNTPNNIQNSIVNSGEASEFVNEINPLHSLATDTQVVVPPSSDDTSSTEITFVPYTQYEGTVTPESPNAHIGEGTMDYGLPLMNCIGTIFQDNMHYTMKSNETDYGDMDFDVPLLQCLKTLEYSNIL